jgi:hypothetical protein
MMHGLTNVKLSIIITISNESKMSMGNFSGPYNHASCTLHCRILIWDFSAKGNISKITVAAFLLMRIYTRACKTGSLVECARSIR